MLLDLVASRVGYSQATWPTEEEATSLGVDGQCRPRMHELQEPEEIFAWDAWTSQDSDRNAGHGHNGGVSTPWAEQARYSVLTLRLQKSYFAYCLLCCFLAAAAFMSTLFDLLHSHRRGLLERDPASGWRDILQGGTWQSACWTIVGLSLLVELGFSVLVHRGRVCIRDWWCMFDATVVSLTGIAWLLTMVRQASPMREEAEEADVWLLFLRFALQPCRVVVAATTAVKVQRMQQNHLDISFDHLAEPPARAGIPEVEAWPPGISKGAYEPRKSRAQ